MQYISKYSLFLVILSLTACPNNVLKDLPSANKKDIEAKKLNLPKAEDPKIQTDGNDQKPNSDNTVANFSIATGLGVTLIGSRILYKYLKNRKTVEMVDSAVSKSEELRKLAKKFQDFGIKYHKEITASKEILDTKHSGNVSLYSNDLFNRLTKINQVETRRDSNTVPFASFKTGITAAERTEFENFKLLIQSDMNGLELLRYSDPNPSTENLKLYNEYLRISKFIEGIG